MTVPQEIRTIDKVTANQVLHHFDHTAGYPGGSFREHLIEAAISADLDNLELLRLGFPAVVGSVYLAKFTPGGLDVLREIAES